VQVVLLPMRRSCSPETLHSLLPAPLVLTCTVSLAPASAVVASSS